MKQGRLNQIIAVLRKHRINRGLTPIKLRVILDDLGPTFVKFGQILSMRQDLIPLEYVKELEKLRMDVKPMTFATVEKQLNRAYEGDYRRYFKSVVENPIGSASIAQVHEAYLEDGSHVVIKVQRQNIYRQMEQDVKIIKRLSRFVRLATDKIKPQEVNLLIDEMWLVAQEEMDFVVEANNIDEFYLNNRQYNYIKVPRVNVPLTRPTVLVMEHVTGLYIDDVVNLEKEGYDLKEIAHKLTVNYVNQILDFGYFHADPHPGNIMVDEGKIIWIDFGMMGRITSRDRKLVADALSAILEHDIYQLKMVLLSYGKIQGDIDHTKLYDDLDLFVTKYVDLDFSNINLGVVVEELFSLTNNHAIGLPSGVTMFARGIMTLEGVLATIAPETNFLEVFAYRLHSVNGELIKKEFQTLLNNLLLSLRSAPSIPKNINNSLRMLLRGQTKLAVEYNFGYSATKLVEKTVYRLVLTFLIGILLVCGTMAATGPMPAWILGLPVLSVGAYLMALILGALLWWSFRTKK